MLKYFGHFTFFLGFGMCMTRVNSFLLVPQYSFYIYRWEMEQKVVIAEANQSLSWMQQQQQHCNAILLISNRIILQRAQFLSIAVEWMRSTFTIDPEIVIAVRVNLLRTGDLARALQAWVSVLLICLSGLCKPFGFS